MATDIDAIVQAMRSDLGLGRVDDLELENGQRGQGLRPGQNAIPTVRRPVANPRNPISAANRWTAAIQKGEFDDDDAEMVKGLDRIGGGRLHALSSTPSFSQQGGRSPFAAGGFQHGRGGPNQQRSSHFPRMPTLGSQDARSSSVPTHRVKPAFPSPTRRTQPPAQHFPPKINHAAVQPPRLPPPPTTQAPPPPAEGPPRAPRSLDPEPPEYFHKVEVQVGDRQAKGKGVVFIVENPGTEADILHVYLGGSVYLQYPLMSMFNYLTTSTQLCLQFREEDGVSVTTTALDFGPQAKMVEFMQAVKTLTQKKRQNIAQAANNKANATKPVTESTSVTSAAVKTPVSTVQNPNAETTNPHSNKSDANPPLVETSVTAALNSTALVSAAPVSTVPVPATTFTAPTVTASPVRVPEPVSCSAQMASDLVDLSQSTDSIPPNQCTQTSRLSTYAMDLESLCSSPTQPRSETSSSDKENANPGFQFPLFQQACTAATQPKAEKKNPLGINTSIQRESIQPAKESADSPQGLIQSYLRTILPALAAMDEVLSIFDNEDCQEIMETAISRVEASESLLNGRKYRQTATTLLKTLMPPVETSLASPASGPRYMAEDIIRLRQYAEIPVQLPTRLRALSDAAKKFETKSRPPVECTQHAHNVHGDSQVVNQKERRDSVLRAEAEPFQPSPDLLSKGLQGVLDFGTTTQTTEVAQPVLAPVPAHVPAPTPSPLAVKPITAGVKGLKSSMWATPAQAKTTSSTFNFTGTKSQDAGITFNFMGGPGSH